MHVAATPEIRVKNRSSAYLRKRQSRTEEGDTNATKRAQSNYGVLIQDQAFCAMGDVVEMERHELSVYDCWLFP